LSIVGALKKVAIGHKYTTLWMLPIPMTSVSINMHKLINHKITTKPDLLLCNLGIFWVSVRVVIEWE